MDTFKGFLLVWAAVVITVLTSFGLCKVAGNMFDRAPSAPTAGPDVNDDRRGCHLKGGTVVAENGQYKECKLEEQK